MTRKKQVLFILVVALELGILSFAGYSVVSNISPKDTAEKIPEYRKFEMQNEAFHGFSSFDYLPYSEKYEQILQTQIALYSQHTGKVITTDDVKAFLANEYNPDGSPKTWQDDETGIIKDYVYWCYKNKEVIDEYWRDLGGIERIWRTVEASQNGI